MTIEHDNVLRSRFVDNRGLIAATEVVSKAILSAESGLTLMIVAKDAVACLIRR